MLKIGIIGVPQCGKTTLYKTLKQDNPDTFGKNGESITITSIEDSKLQELAQIYNPKKITKTKIEISDSPSSGSSTINTREATRLRNLNGLICVIPAFENEDISYEKLAININSSIEEICLQDLPIVESSIEKIYKEIKKGTNPRAKELDVLEKINSELNLSKLPEIKNDEKLIVKGYQFISLKPIYFVINISEKNINSPKFAELNLKLKERWPEATIDHACLELEKDLQELDDDEKEIFLEEYDLKNPIFNILLKQIFLINGRHFFYTAGPTEVRSWDIPINSTIQEAAGAIHKDLAKNFIKGDVWPSDKVIELKGESNAKKGGFWTLQGKDYIVRNGDLILVRHSG